MRVLKGLMLFLIFFTFGKNTFCWQGFKILAKIPSHEEVMRISFFPKGCNFVAWHEDNTADLWALFFTPFTKIMCNIPDGGGLCGSKVFYAQVKGKNVIIWDLYQQKPLACLKGHKGEVEDLSISPNGNFIATASMDHTIRLWNLNTYKCVRVFKGHKWAVNCVSFSPDGNLLASGSTDRTVRLWNLQGREISKYKNEVSITYLDFSPNGKYIAVASLSPYVKIMEVPNLKVIDVLKGHTDSVNCVKFSTNGKYIATSSVDGYITVWSANVRK